MGEVVTIGLDIAKSVFQVHGVDGAGEVVVRRQLRRAQVLPVFAKLPPCLIGIEACATAHYWARELTALGHRVRLMPPSYVKPYVKHQKNDAADAEAICGRNLAAWIGLVPKQNSSGGKERLGGITKQGDRYLRQLLVVGALAVVRYAERHGTRRPWLVQLLAKRPTKVATVALANKIARIAWAIMTSGESYREPEPAAA